MIGRYSKPNSDDSRRRRARPTGGPTPEKARERVEQGFRNFLWSTHDFVIQDIFRRHLGPGRYHLTDVAKGAMLAKNARKCRFDRYDRWFESLLDELGLLCLHGAAVVAIGNLVGDYLQSGVRKVIEVTGGSVYRIPHYSSVAVRHHLKYADDHEEEFGRFAASSRRSPRSIRQSTSCTSLVSRKRCGLRYSRGSKRRVSGTGSWPQRSGTKERSVI